VIQRRNGRQSEKLEDTQFSYKCGAFSETT
jgi:hypothetical protein